MCLLPLCMRRMPSIGHCFDETGTTLKRVHVPVTPNGIPWCPPDSQEECQLENRFIEDNAYERHPHSRHFATEE